MPIFTDAKKFKDFSQITLPYYPTVAQRTSRILSIIKLMKLVHLNGNLFEYIPPPPNKKMLHFHSTKTSLSKPSQMLHQYNQALLSMETKN